MATRDFTFNWFLEQIVLEQNRTEKNTELGSEWWTGTGRGSSNEQITQLYKFQHKFPIPTEKESPKNPSYKFLNFKNSQPIISTEKKWKWVIKNSTATLTQPGRFPKCSQTLFADRPTFYKGGNDSAERWHHLPTVMGPVSRRSLHLSSYPTVTSTEEWLETHKWGWSNRTKIFS